MGWRILICIKIERRKLKKTSLTNFDTTSCLVNRHCAGSHKLIRNGPVPVKSNVAKKSRNHNWIKKKEGKIVLKKDALIS
jgi:hypothetical protein